MKLPGLRVRRLHPTILEIVGLLLLVVGVGWVWLPLGVITGGKILVIIAQGIREPPDEPAS